MTTPARPSLILDASGQPYLTTGSRIVRRSSIDTYSTHPGVGMTPDAYAAYLRMAERGDPCRQFDAWEDLVETDGHGRGLVNARIELTSGCDWTLTPGRADKPSEIAAAALEERIRSRTMFREFIEHQLTAPFFGIAGTNLVWDLVDGWYAPDFVNVAHRRFRAPSQERADEIMLVNPDARGVIQLEELEPGRWAVSRYRHRNPWAAGLFRTMGWWIMFKRLRIRDWSVFAEMFGLPLTIGFYEEGASQISRNALEDAVRSIGTDGYAILSSACDIVMKEAARAGDSSTVYPKIADRCDAEMSKLIAGGTANTDIGNKGSYAAGSIHADRAYALARADATRLNEMFTRDIGAPFCRFNGLDRAAPPQLEIYTRRDGKEFAETLAIIGQVIGIDPGQLYRFFGLRTPADGKGVKFPTKAIGTSPTDGGSSDGN